ncbi:MAG: PH domain-containing protein [Acidimicrobiales bacterium]
MSDTSFTNRSIPLDERPVLQDKDFQRLDPRLLQMRTVLILVPNAVLAIGAVAVASLLDSARWLGLVALALVLVATITQVGVIRLSFRFWGYAVREHDLTVRRGVILRSVTSVPFNRVQHAALHNGPIERAFGLSTIRVFTAGGSGADLAIEGLAANDAATMQDLILAAVAKAGQSTATPEP